MDEEGKVIAVPGAKPEEYNNDIEVVDEQEEAVNDDESFEVNEDDSSASTEVSVDEDEDESSNEENKDEEVEDKKPKKAKKKHVPLKAEFNKIQREKYRALNQADELRKENERLQSMLSQSNEAATSHYDKSIEYQIQKAREMKKTAYENADTELMIEADELLATSVSQKRENDRWKNEQSYYKTQQEQERKAQQHNQQQQYNEPAPEMNDETESWISSNSWIDPNSNDFDQDMAQDVEQYSALLEQQFIRQGRDDEVFGREYFKRLDRYVAESYGGGVEDSSPKQKRVNLNMKQVRNNVAPVTSSQGSGGNSGSPNKVVLSAREREFARTMGIDPKDYALQKHKIAKSNRYGYESYKR